MWFRYAKPSKSTFQQQLQVSPGSIGDSVLVPSQSRNTSTSVRYGILTSAMIQ